MTPSDRLLTLSLFLALYGYLTYWGYRFHLVVSSVPAIEKVVGL